jgi:hypothetical protein
MPEAGYGDVIVKTSLDHDLQAEAERAVKDALIYGRPAGVGQGSPGSLGGEVAGRLIIARAMALPDTRAFLDPFVRRIDDPGQISVGDDLFRQEGADAGHGAADDAH